ncbi:hypothetical protein [Actinomadura litoris]|nr:hypothetical protein [Actinomadura litoris]
MPGSTTRDLAHHWALGTGHMVADLKAVAGLLEIDLVHVDP